LRTSVSRQSLNAFTSATVASSHDRPNTRKNSGRYLSLRA
jgi:hypothetical protein